MPSQPSSPTTTGKACLLQAVPAQEAPAWALCRSQASFLFLHLYLCFASRENRPRNGGICVANHTSPIDVIILASDGYYAMVRNQLCLPGPGRLHGGRSELLMGQEIVSRSPLSMENYFSLHGMAGHCQALLCRVFVQAQPGTQSSRVCGHSFARRALDFAVAGRAKHFPSGTSCPRESTWGLLCLPVKLTPGTSLSLSRVGAGR